MRWVVWLLLCLGWLVGNRTWRRQWLQHIHVVGDEDSHLGMRREEAQLD